MMLAKRVIYFGALFIGTLLYLWLSGSSSPDLVGMLWHLVPASGIAVLIALAMGAIGIGFGAHLKAVVLVLAMIFVVSLFLSTTGLTGMFVHAGGGSVPNLTGMINSYIVPNVTVP